MAERKTFLLRLPPEVWDELNRLAKDELRSVNAQIEYIVREALKRRGRATRDPGELGGFGATPPSAED